MEVAVIKKRLALALGLVLALAGAASAQIATGNIYGVVRDQSGALMPGANATITSDVGTRSTVTGADGTFRFINLNRGDYTVTVSLSGFAAASRKVRVTTGENVELDFGLRVSGVAETVEVQAETPLVDSKKRGTATTMTTEELQQVPSARDPWGVLKNVPGVLLDRVNIAGNENGQQASAAGKGSTSDDKMWNLDGLVITDMSATGASPTYFDFDAFQEISVTTGGADLAVQAGGIGINMTTKRGTNAFHGGVRAFFAHDDLSSGNVPDSMKNDPRLQGSDKADHIQQISDYGFDFGGPIVKDKLWFYGSYGKQDIRLTRLTQTADKTLLPSYNGKLNWQMTAEHDAVGLLLPGQQAEVRPLASAIRSTRPTTSSGTRTTPSPRAACRAGSGSSRSTTPSRRTSSSRRRPRTTTPDSASSRAAGWTRPTRSTTSWARRSARTSSTRRSGRRRC